MQKSQLAQLMLLPVVSTHSITTLSLLASVSLYACSRRSSPQTQVVVPILFAHRAKTHSQQMYIQGKVLCCKRIFIQAARM